MQEACLDRLNTVVKRCLRNNVIAGENCTLFNSCEFKTAFSSAASMSLISVRGRFHSQAQGSLGAGVICSNVRLDKRNVMVKGIVRRHELSENSAPPSATAHQLPLSPQSRIHPRTRLHPLPPHPHWQSRRAQIVKRSSRRISSRRMTD
jgi:hypothetical protein